MMSPETRADQVYNAFMNIVGDANVAKQLTYLSIENMGWASYTKHEDDYFKKMKKHIYEKESN